MLVYCRVLVKGVTNELYKGNGQHYPKVHVFGIEGAAADLAVDVDMETQKDLFGQAEKMRGQLIELTCDLTFFNQRPRFSLVGFKPATAVQGSK